MEPNQIKIPRGSYKVKVCEVKNSDSKAGNPMVTVDLEIIESPDIQVADEDGNMVSVSPNGLQVRTWVTKVAQSLGSVNTFMRCFGLPTVTEAELPNLDSNLFLGKVGYAILEGGDRNLVDGANKPIINPHTGKPETVLERKVVKLQVP